MGKGAVVILLSLHESLQKTLLTDAVGREAILCGLPELAIHLLMPRLELLSRWPHGPALMGFTFYSRRRQIINIEAKNSDFQREG